MIWKIQERIPLPAPNKKTTELLGLGCPFIWRRKRDSNPRGFWPNGFQDRLVVTASIFLHITATHRAAVICRNIYTALKNSFFRIRFAYPTKSSGSLLTSDECGYPRTRRDIPLQPFWIVIYY